MYTENTSDLGQHLVDPVQRSGFDIVQVPSPQKRENMPE
jgi:hypothetical protein